MTLGRVVKEVWTRFQIRLGNKVESSHIVNKRAAIDLVPAIRCCKQLRVYQATLDHQPI